MKLLMLGWASKLFITLKINASEDKNMKYIFSPCDAFYRFPVCLKYSCIHFILFCLFVCFLICVGTVSVLSTEIPQPQKSSASTFSSVFWFSDRKWRRVTLHSTVSKRNPGRYGWWKTSTVGGFLWHRWGQAYSAYSSSIKMSYRGRKKKNLEKIEAQAFDLQRWRRRVSQKTWSWIVAEDVMTHPRTLIQTTPAA